MMGLWRIAMKTDRNLCLRTGTKPRNPHPKTTHLQATQFAKGRSGNPGGRPKGLILLSEATLAWLAEADPKTGMTNAMLVTLALGKKALAGDVVAARELADRVVRWAIGHLDPNHRVPLGACKMIKQAYVQPHDQE